VTSSALAFHLAIPRRQCRECVTIIPADRELCYFCERPPAPQAVPSSRLEHVRAHLRQQDREYLEGLLEAVSLDEIASRSPGVSRRMVEYAWASIRLTMRLSDGSHGNRTGLERMALVRIVAGLDACWCE
jgi:hypothetical protein